MKALWERIKGLIPGSTSEERSRSGAALVMDVRAEPKLTSLAGESHAKRLLKDYLELHRRGFAVPPTCLIGDSGTGKSASIFGWAREAGLRLVYLNVPSAAPRDFEAVRSLAGRRTAIYLDNLHGLRRIETLLPLLDAPPATMFLSSNRLIADRQVERRVTTVEVRRLDSEALESCAMQGFARLGVDLNPNAAPLAVRYSRGLPGRIMALARRACARAQARGMGCIGPVLLESLLEEEGFDPISGLYEMELGALMILARQKRAMGIRTLRSRLGDRTGMWDQMEPWLLERGYIAVQQGEGRWIDAAGLALLQEMDHGG